MGVKIAILPMAVVALLLISNTANAASSTFTCIVAPSTTGPFSYGPGVSDSIAQCLNGTFPFIVIGLLFSFYFVALSFLIGEVIGIQSFKGWYRAELWEAVKSIGIVAIIFAVIIFLGAMAGFFVQYSNGPGCSAGPTPFANISALFCDSSGFLGNEIIHPVNDSFYNALGVAVGAGLMRSISLSGYNTLPFPPVPIPGVPCCYGSLNLGSDTNLYQSSILDTTIPAGPTFLKDLNNLLVYPMVMIMIVQYYLTLVLMSVGLGVFLPLGLILRAVPFLRGIGGTLIALAIAVAVIYPSLIVFVNAPITGTITFSAPTCPPVNTELGTGLSTALLQLAYATAYGIQGVAFSGIPNQAAFQCGYSAAVDTFFTGNAADSGGSVISVIFDYQLPMVLQFILFVIDLIMAIVLAQQIAKMLGGSLRLGFGKMKLA